MESNLSEREKSVMYGIYKRLPIMIERAEGCRIYSAEGDNYLDFLSGIAVNTLGHANIKILNAIEYQIRRYMHLSNYFYQEPQIALAEKLVALSGLSKVYFSNSGAESFEGALKLAAKWGSTRGKKNMYAFSGGFHGRTYGSLSMMDKPLYKEGMGPFLEHKFVLPFNDIGALRSAIDENTCAIALECVQGEGGISMASQEFIDELIALRQRFDFLIIADEIQGGIGRTGKFMSYMHYNHFTPDIVTLAKGIGGGLPLGAILFHERVADVWVRGNHGTTFGGNAVSCAAGLVVLQEVEEWAQDNAATIGGYLRSQLNEVADSFPADIVEIRGKGLMAGIVMSYDAQQIVDALLQEKVICNVTAGSVVRVLPPLIIGVSEVDEFIYALTKVLRNRATEHKQS
jgi:acetylornithine/N-succinyldiaminopimelate aminotransferase